MQGWAFVDIYWLLLFVWYNIDILSVMFMCMNWETGKTIIWEMLPEEKKVIECSKEQRTYGMWWYSPAFLFAAADLVYALQEDWRVVLHTEGQKYASWTWMTFEEYTVNNVKAVEDAHAMETARRNQEGNTWIHKGKA